MSRGFRISVRTETCSIQITGLSTPADFRAAVRFVNGIVSATRKEMPMVGDGGTFSPGEFGFRLPGEVTPDG